MNDCLQCGKKTPNPKYCSRGCSASSRRTGEERICVYCKKSFYAKRRKLEKGNGYCSRTCQTSDKRPLSRRVCQNKNCGKYFMVSPWLYRVRKYCSAECWADVQRKLPKRQKCPYCGNEFTCERRKKRKYCSVSCARKSKRKLSKCRHCGKTFWNPSKGKVFCSARCRKENRKESYGTCAWCGEKKSGKKQERFCSISCASMNKHYGDVDIRLLAIPNVMVYLNEESAGIWLPVTAAEIEIVKHLFNSGMGVEDMVPHIKRWRAARQEYREGPRVKRGSRF